MKRVFKSFILIVAILLTVASPVSPALAKNLGHISSAELTALIRDRQAKVLLLNFWSTWCGPCRKEIPGLIELRGEYSEGDLMILGVSLDYNPGTVTAFDQKLGINYPVYIADPDVLDEYEVAAIPKNMIYDRKGLIEVHEGHVPTRMLRKLIDLLLAGGPEGAEGNK